MFRPLLASLILASATVLPAAPPLIELKGSQGEVWLGKSVAHNDESCWLMESNGRLHCVELEGLTSFRKVGQEFQPANSVSLRSELSTEFGKKYEVQTRGDYVVVAPSGKGRDYAELFDSVYRAYWQHFSRRNFGLTKPEYPLVAVVFASEADFKTYAVNDAVAVSSTLKGYYHPGSNRIAFFETPAGKKTTAALPGMQTALDELLSASALRTCRQCAAFRQEAYLATSDTGNTLVHEAVHQLAFNTGLHSRLAETPRWLVEGVAMMFEVQLNKDAPEGPRGGKINVERLDWFRKNLQSRRHTLQTVITEDELVFSTDTLGAYAESWSLAYFLSETRSADFAKYLKQVASRSILEPYDPVLRLQDFQNSFGKDVSRLEVDFLRFIDGL